MAEVDRVLGTSGNTYNAVFTTEDEQAFMDPMDFINLMVAQMQNQDFTNPMDDTQMITQMAQYTMVTEMQDMSYHSQQNYAISLVGKEVTASRYTVGGEIETTTGIVDKISMVDNEYVLYIGGKKYEMYQLMEVGASEGATLNTEIMDIGVSGIGSSQATLEWPVPTEDEIAESGLKFSVYYSEEGPFDTVELVEEGTLYGMEGQSGLYTENIVGLNPNTTYYVNVVVEDANGKKSVYKASMLKTMSI